MKVAILILTFFLISCNSNSPKTDSDNLAGNDTENDIDMIQLDKDSDDLSDEALAESDETPDVDMYCPIAINAKYPYFREDGTIHFCRPCDTPDEYDPQCIKSLWKDLNKEVYDKYKNGEFEDNELIAECYPWPCGWDVAPTPRVPESTSVHKCDIFLNPRTWANPFTGYERVSSMDNGKLVFWISNYRIGDKESINTFPGYAGQRSVMYDIDTGKYEVLGFLNNPFYANNLIIAEVIGMTPKEGYNNFNVYYWIISITPYKESYKYEVIYKNNHNRLDLDSAPYMTDKWTIMVVNNLDVEGSSDTRSLVYAKTGEWKWTTLAHGYPDGKAGELSIAGDKAMFAHIATNTSYICDLSKSPKSLSDCKKISREGESAGFPKFDKDNPNRIVYRSIVDGGATNKMVIVDISKEPWKIEKEFEIPSTEAAFLSIWLMEFKSNVILYEENYVMNESGYQEDGKLCYYRIDKGKTYCSKPIENQTSYGHGYANFEGKYLFWQPMYKAGYILRDMDCYCKEEGVCPFE